ncbi:hypothetical protein [Nisaea sediminum]|uniref:hypothetical protein n=1 Tax=Nisaea sediminum TaxID=2775867 RepID=UPI0018667E2B|nr:hypothetical protein [Nisaea sediminum]
MTPAKMGGILRRLGEAAIYTPPSGPAVACHVKRVGGARSVQIGQVTVTVFDLGIHVLRDALTPVSGGQISIGSQTWTIGAVEPLEKDPLGLLWNCRATWGVPVIWKHKAGAGTTRQPVIGGPFAASGDAGVGLMTVAATGAHPFAAGILSAGAKITVGGTEYTVTGEVKASSNQFTNVPVTPVLAATYASVACEITQAGENSITAAVGHYSETEILGGVASGDRRLVVRASEFATAPEPGDVVEMEGDELLVVDARPIFEGATIAVWDVQLRK